jgi:hypothetical protein
MLPAVLITGSATRAAFNNPESVDVVVTPELAMMAASLAVVAAVDPSDIPPVAYAAAPIMANFARSFLGAHIRLISFPLYYENLLATLVVTGNPFKF